MLDKHYSAPCAPVHMLAQLVYMRLQVYTSYKLNTIKVCVYDSSFCVADAVPKVSLILDGIKVPFVVFRKTLSRCV